VLLLLVVLTLLYGPSCSLCVLVNDSVVVSLPLAGFTTKWYGEALRNPRLIESLRNSLVVLSLSLPAALVVGTVRRLRTDEVPLSTCASSGWTDSGADDCALAADRCRALLMFSELGIGLSLRTAAAMHVVVTCPLVQLWSRRG